MSSLSHRLKQLQVPVAEELPALPPMSLEELSEMTVNFGSTHKGKTFLEMWESHQKWIVFMTDRYTKSTKTEHRRLMEFIELKIQEAEALGIPIPLTDSPNKPENSGYPQGTSAVAKGSATRPQPKTKSKAKMNYRPATAFPEPDEMEQLEDSWSEAELPHLTDTQADP